MSSLFSKPFFTWTHFLSRLHLNISAYHQTSTVYSFPEWGLFSLLLIFQPVFAKHWDPDLVPASGG